MLSIWLQSPHLLSYSTRIYIWTALLPYTYTYYTCLNGLSNYHRFLRKTRRTRYALRIPEKKNLPGDYHYIALSLLLVVGMNSTTAAVHSRTMDPGHAAHICNSDVINDLLFLFWCVYTVIAVVHVEIVTACLYYNICGSRGWSFCHTARGFQIARLCVPATTVHRLIIISCKYPCLDTVILYSTRSAADYGNRNTGNVSFSNFVR